MGQQSSILVVDDDADWLALCSELLTQLPSKPLIHTVGTGTRAIAKLDEQPCRLLICDLKMPKLDGLQVLAVVRRRFPDLRTVVVTGLEGEDYRSRAYALGVDMFWLKSEMQQNLNMFLDCIESLLGSDRGSGFRGIQSKSLMDIIQLECISRNSTLLEIHRGPLVGKIWIRDGELIDAEVETARGEAAFQRILAWKSGSFENRPGEPGRERTIIRSVNALLLESAQTFDEKSNQQTEFIEHSEHQKNMWRLSLIAAEGAEFVVTAPIPARRWKPSGRPPPSRWPAGRVMRWKIASAWANVWAPGRFPTSPAGACNCACWCCPARTNRSWSAGRPTPRKGRCSNEPKN